MKYVVLVPDGAADYAIDELDGKTPLEASRTPNMDWLARCGIVGQARTIPPGAAPGSDIATLSILGYDPLEYYTGRGPLEAASRNIPLRKDEFAFRCNLVTEADGVLKDYSAGHISSCEAKELIEFIDQELGSENVKFYPGVSYRHLLVMMGEFSEVSCVPPHDVVGEPYMKNLPRGKNSEALRELILASLDLLIKYPVNQKRVREGRNPGNMVWLWGQGKAPTIPSFKERFGLEGSIISAVDLVKGIGNAIGLRVIEVPGATGYYDTDYEGKAKAAVNALEEEDFVLVHVEATDEAGHSGNVDEKIAAIEDFDRKIVGGILEGLENYRLLHKILVLPDHATPVSVKTHTSEPVPFVIYSSGNGDEKERVFSESSAKESSLYFDKGYELMDFFIKNNR